MAEESVAVSVDPKLTSIRELMKLKGGYNALVVPTTDPHLLEYAPAHLHRRMFLTGFTGSAGRCRTWNNGNFPGNVKSVLCLHVYCAHCNP